MLNRHFTFASLYQCFIYWFQFVSSFNVMYKQTDIRFLVRNILGRSVDVSFHGIFLFSQKSIRNKQHHRCPHCCYIIPYACFLFRNRVPTRHIAFAILFLLVDELLAVLDANALEVLRYLLACEVVDRSIGVECIRCYIVNTVSYSILKSEESHF